MVFYTTKGEGLPLILLHSGGMTQQEWAPNIDFLCQYYQLMLIDLPGHGQTPMQGEQLTIEECVEAVLWVMQQENIENAAICGSSMGGVTALNLTLEYSEKVSHLILYRANYHKTANAFEYTKEIASPEYWQKMGLENYLSRLHEAQGGKDAWKNVVLRVRDALNPNIKSDYYNIEDLTKITQPTLIVTGDRDPLVPLDDAILMYRTLPNADLWVLPHASHVTATNTWRADSFSEELHRFLRRR